MSPACSKNFYLKVFLIFSVLSPENAAEIFASFAQILDNSLCRANWNLQHYCLRLVPTDSLTTSLPQLKIDKKITSIFARYECLAVMNIEMW